MSRKPRGATHDHFAIAYLNVVLEEADEEELVAALSRIARRGGRSRVVESRLVEKIELNAQALYRALCVRGNPELKSATALLRALGIRLTVQPVAATRSVTAHRDASDRAALSTPEPDLIWSAADVPRRCGRRNGALY